MGIVEREIKPLWMQTAAPLYGSVEEAEAGWERLNALIAARERAASVERRRAAAERRADREARQARGLTTAVETCGRCMTQHRGEC